MLLRMGFKRFETEHCMYVKLSATPIIISVYGDDILVAVKTLEEMENVKQSLAAEYKVTDCGPVNKHLGVEINQDQEKGTVTLHQETYLKGILKRFAMENCSPKSTPLPTGLRLDPEDAGDLLHERDKSRYCSAAGAIMYAVVYTRIDLAYPASLLSQFLNEPRVAYEKALQHVLRYICGSLKVGITYSKWPLIIVCTDISYTDADHAGSVFKSGRKSTSGYVFLLAGGSVLEEECWNTKSSLIHSRATDTSG
jgi:Reverse transcriptase (RNA-dependent DNA polymerase)